MLFGINAQPFTVHKIQPELVNYLDTLYVSPSGVTNLTTGRQVSMDLGLPPKYSAAKLGDFVYGTSSRPNIATTNVLQSSFKSMTALQPTLIQLSEVNRTGGGADNLQYQPSGPFVMVVLSEFWDYTLGSLVNGRLRRIAQPLFLINAFTVTFRFETASLGNNGENVEIMTQDGINAFPLTGLISRPAYILVYKVVGDRPPTIGWLPFNLSSHGLVATDRIVFNSDSFTSMCLVSRQANFAEVGGNVYRRLMTYLDPVTANMTPRAQDLGFYLE